MLEPKEILARGFFLAGLLVAFPAFTSPPAPARTCAALERMRNAPLDASAILADCLAQTPAGGTLQLSPGVYTLRTVLAITKPVTIETRSAAGESCSPATGEGCALLALAELAIPATAGTMPIEIAARDVRFRSIVVEGMAGRSQRWASSICLDRRLRPLGGGIRVKASNFHFEHAAVRNVSCYSAMEVLEGVNSPQVADSIFGPNGRHDVAQMWADGLTIHDTIGARVMRTLFIDNTDVQLIFGGCRDCVVDDNRFRHNSSFSGASFAELMLHAWPKTSGDFTGSMFDRNDIDCGVSIRCGYGIMIGGEPWYPSRAFGGAVIGNRVSRAQLGINVDRLTGPMRIEGNRVVSSGGVAGSDCGAKRWPAINISPDSQPFVSVAPAGAAALQTRGCLLNRHS